MTSDDEQLQERMDASITGCQVSAARPTIEDVTRATHAAAYRALCRDFPAGLRVELHPALDDWMRGDRFGTVVKVGRRTLAVYVKLDKSGRTKRYQSHNLQSAVCT